MKQNKKTVMIIGCITTICTFIAAVLIGWNHMVKITKGPKNEKEIGYYQWNYDQMDSFLDIHLHITETVMRQLMAVEMEP